MNRKGFTLIELMVVIVIVGILAAVAIPKFNEANRKAKICMSLEGKGYRETDILKAYTEVKDQCYRNGVAFPTEVSQIENMVVLQMKSSKIKKKPKPSAPAQKAEKQLADTSVSILGEYAVFGKDANVLEVIKGLKENQEKNGYKYIDSVITDGTTVKVKLRKY